MKTKQHHIAPLAFLFSMIAVLSIHLPAKADYSHDTLSVYFGKNDFGITSAAKQKLATLDLDIQSIYLEGFTDPDGKREYNVQLSNKRALSLKSSLVALGIPNDKISFVGKGALGNTKTLDEYQKANLRRVDIFVVYNSPKIILKRPQVLFFKSGTDTLVQGKEGTLLEFKASSLDIAPNQVVRVELTEYLTPSAVLHNNLYTLSNNEPLESAGMIKLEAFDISENTVNIKPGEKMVIRLPNKNKLSAEGFEDFYGEENETTKEINWKVSIDTSDVLWADTLARPALEEKTIQDMFRKLVQKENLKCNEITEVKFMVMKNGKIKNIEFSDWDLDKNAKRSITDFLIKKTTWLPAQHKGVRYNMYVTEYFYNKEAEAAITPPAKVVATAPPVTKKVTYTATMEVSYLGLSIERLGWINCDRFSNYPPSTIVNFRVKTSAVTRAKLIFKNELSMLPVSSIQYNELTFANIPKNLRVFVYLEKHEGNKKYISFSETTTSSDTYAAPVFVEATEEVLQAIDRKLYR